jgi:ribulose 1,5-bisphosphate carboxylase large subunit-like protein
MNKLSLIGMQLPEEYKNNFEVPLSGVTAIPANKGLFILLNYDY